MRTCSLDHQRLPIKNFAEGGEGGGHDVSRRQPIRRGPRSTSRGHDNASLVWISFLCVCVHFNFIPGNSQKLAKEEKSWDFYPRLKKKSVFIEVVVVLFLWEHRTFFPQTNVPFLLIQFHDVCIWLKIVWRRVWMFWWKNLDDTFILTVSSYLVISGTYYWSIHTQVAQQSGKQKNKQQVFHFKCIYYTYSVSHAV